MGHGESNKHGVEICDGIVILTNISAVCSSCTEIVHIASDGRAYLQHRRSLASSGATMVTNGVSEG